MGDNPGNILVQCLFVLFRNEGFPPFDSEDNVYVKLGIGIRHDIVLWRLYSPVAPLGLGCWSVRCVSIHLSPLWGLDFIQSNLFFHIGHALDVK